MAQEDAVLFPLHDLKESSEKVRLVPAFKQKSEAYRSCKYSKKIISQPHETMNKSLVDDAIIIIVSILLILLC